MKSKQKPADRDPNSKRSKRRNARGFDGLSRPRRRAARRLAWAMKIYENAKGDSSYNKPGATKHW